MAEQQQKKELRSRVFNCLQYEFNPKTGENLNFNESNILSCISHKSIKRYAYACHDKDTVTEADIETGKGMYNISDLGKLKGRHWHIVLELSTPLPVSTIAKWLGIPENFVEVPKGRGAFIDCVEYLRHSDIRQALNGKYEYDISDIKSNFDWETEVEMIIARKTKYEKPLSEEDYIRNEVLYRGMTLKEVREKYPTMYQNKMQIFKRLRLEYVSSLAPMPTYRINFYIEGQTGYGKDTMAYSIARSLFPDLKEDAYFEIGSKKVTFDGYDGEPVIIWSEFRASTFVDIMGGYENVLSSIDIIPKNKREHKKFGDVRLTNSINIITSTQPYDDFLRGLIDRSDPSPEQANRRFPIIIRLHVKDFDILINSGYLSDNSTYHDYQAWKHLQGSFGELARRLSAHQDLRNQIEEKMTKPLIEAHDTVAHNIKADEYEGLSDAEIMQNFLNYGESVPTKTDISNSGFFVSCGKSFDDNNIGFLNDGFYSETSLPTNQQADFLRNEVENNASKNKDCKAD